VYGKMLLVKIGTKDPLLEYDLLRGHSILTPKQFETFIRRLVKTWESGPGSVGVLNTNIVTAYGWHAYNGTSERHSALISATDAYGFTHIRRLLHWLSIAWPRHPLLYIYSSQVRKDYDWYKANVASGRSVYWKQKTEFVQSLDSEFSSLTNTGSLGLIDYHILITQDTS